MKYTLTSILFLGVMLLAVACSDSALNDNSGETLSSDFATEAEKRGAPDRGGSTIADIVVASAEADEPQFTLLLAALQYTGLTDVFTGGSQYTVFAPTDEAFLKLVESLEVGVDTPFDDIDAMLGEDTVANVLLYHVTNGRRASNSVVPPVGGRKIQTLLSGATFSVGSNGFITDIAGQEVEILTPNISASNGIIHVIDTVLLPLD